MPEKSTIKHPFRNGISSLVHWIGFSLLVTGIPFIFFLILSIVNEDLDIWNGLTEMSAFFFGVTGPAVFEFPLDDIGGSKLNNIDTKNISGFLHFMITLGFVIYTLVYGYIATMRFHNMQLSNTAVANLNVITISIGTGCCLAVAISQFLRGYYAE